MLTHQLKTYFLETAAPVGESSSRGAQVLCIRGRYLLQVVIWDCD